MVLIFQLHYAMDVVVQKPQEIWREQFNKLPKGTYNASAGYNYLELRLFEDNRQEVVHTHPTILAHGFGASPYTMIEYARIISPHKVPGDLLVFSFEDAYYNGLFITKSSLGQVSDIKSLLVAMKCAYDSKFPACNLFGQSRGAGTIPNALAVLNTNVDEWVDDFANIKEFFEADRLAILEMIKKGVVVLDTPMVTPQAGIKAITNIFLRGMFIEEKVCDFIDKKLLPRITSGKYSSSGMKAKSSVCRLPEGLKVLVSYQKDDRIVGNKHDKKFAKKLIDRLGKENVWVVLGNDNKKQIDQATWQVLEADGKVQPRLGIKLPYDRVFAHNAGYFILLQRGVVNAFFQQRGASYYNDESKLTEGAEILDKSQPDDFDFETYFNNYDMNNPLKQEVVQNSVQQKNGPSRRILFIGIIAVLLNLFMRQYSV